MRALVAAMALAGVAAFAIDWDQVLLSSTRLNTDDAQLQGDPVTLQTRVAGYLQDVPVQDYAVVHRGDLLFAVQDVDYRARVDQAAAALAMAEAAVTVARAQLAGQEAEIAVAVAQIHDADAGLIQAGRSGGGNRRCCTPSPTSNVTGTTPSPARRARVPPGRAGCATWMRRRLASR